MGRRLCAALNVKLEGTVASWWREYDRKEHSLMVRWVKYVVENQFNGAVDARTAEIELEKISLGAF